MKILFFGDSITDAGRNYERQGLPFNPGGLGTGYVGVVASELSGKNPDKYQVINTGISGHRSVDLYARIKKDCWNYEPDVLSIYVGVNEVWHEIFVKNGVEIDRFEKVYRMMIEDTLKQLPNIKIMLVAPFVRNGAATESHYEEFLYVKEYAKVVKKLAEEYKFPLVELQDKIDAYAEKYGDECTLLDGVHPALGGARVIADAWLKVFREKVDN